MDNRAQLFVFIPDTLEKCPKGYLEGFIKRNDNDIFVYITNKEVQQHSSKPIGHYNLRTSEETNIKSPEWIEIDRIDNKLEINFYSDWMEIGVRPICIIYCFADFSNSHVVPFKTSQYGKHFEILINALKNHKHCEHIPKTIKYNSYNALARFIFFTNVFHYIFKTLQYSYTFKHFYIYVNTVKWFWTSIKKPSFKVVNTIIAKVLDIFMGLVILGFILQYSEDLSRLFSLSAHEIISSLRKLLKFLMGSPVGLKLNYAFNSTLGNAFLYHITLWWTFLRSTNFYLNKAFHFLVLPAATLGLSFQTAIIADVFALFTFHVYCIYIYAARLYGLQVRGLVSLWRLFIGRKFNPLRKRVDSFQYSHHQLFIGTLAFTILLFLLPTTLLYYTVFATLRVCVIFIQGILTRLRYLLQCLPVYPTILWLANSKTVAGTIRLEVSKNYTDTLVLYACLKADPWIECYRNSLPKTVPPVASSSWSVIIRNIFTGKLI